MNVVKSIKGSFKTDEQLNRKSVFLLYRGAEKSYEVRISPFFGSNIYFFKNNKLKIFHCDIRKLIKRKWTGCFILWPFPNRVRNKQFTFEERKYDLRAIIREKSDRNLIHGLVDNKIWKFGSITKTSTSVSATTFIDITSDSKIYKYFPFKSRLELCFTLSSAGLKITYTVFNLSRKNLPFGFALHPYFPKYSTLSPQIFLPVKKIMVSDNNLLPSGKLRNISSEGFDFTIPQSVSKLKLDSVFTDIDFKNQLFIDFTRVKSRVNINFSPDFTHLVVYTKPENYFCIENQTGSTDMINLHNKGLLEKNKTLLKAAHLMILKPGQSHSGYIVYNVLNY